MTTLKNTGNSPKGSAKPSALVVDDEVLTGKSLADTLDDLGFDTRTVGTYAEAVAITKVHGSFTVAFVDLALPDGTGLELISALRATQPELPVVIASDYGAMVARDMDDEDQSPPLLTRPYDKQVVASVLIDLGIKIPRTPH